MEVKKKKGAALVIVIMVMAVMTILGASILSVSLAQTKEASYEDKRLQAHYLARSGAEATLSAWEKASDTNKPLGTASTVYLNSSNQFVNSQPSDMKGKFDVIVTPPSSGNADTVITSIGTVGTVSQTVTVTIEPTTTQVSVPPLSLSDAILGHTLDWYDYTSGQINTIAFPPAPTGKTVLLEAKGGKGLKIPNKNSPSVTYTADKMVFTSDVQVLHNSIILVSNIIAFNGDVDFSANDGKGDITLKLLTPNGYTVNGTPGWGVVYFKDKAYYYKNGAVIKNTGDLSDQTKLVPISPPDPNSSNPYLSSRTETTTTYSVLWD